MFLKPRINIYFVPCLLNDWNARVNKSNKKKHPLNYRTTENEFFLATFILYYTQMDNIWLTHTR